MDGLADSESPSGMRVAGVGAPIAASDAPRDRSAPTRASSAAKEPALGRHSQHSAHLGVSVSSRADVARQMVHTAGHGAVGRRIRAT